MIMLFLSSCAFSFDGLPFHTAKSILAAQFHIPKSPTYGDTEVAKTRQSRLFPAMLTWANDSKGWFTFIIKINKYFLTYTSWFVGMKFIFPGFLKVMLPTVQWR